MLAQLPVDGSRDEHKRGREQEQDQDQCGPGIAHETPGPEVFAHESSEPGEHDECGEDQRRPDDAHEQPRPIAGPQEKPNQEDERERKRRHADKRRAERKPRGAAGREAHDGQRPRVDGGDRRHEDADESGGDRRQRADDDRALALRFDVRVEHRHDGEHREDRDEDREQQSADPRSPMLRVASRAVADRLQLQLKEMSSQSSPSICGVPRTRSRKRSSSVMLPRTSLTVPEASSSPRTITATWSQTRCTRSML
ncbi:hypothetical protein ACFPRL_29900 [Pseudoclavibacter helvolus]